MHQVAAFKHPAQAEQLSARLQAAGIKAQVRKDGEWHLVQVLTRGESEDITTLRDRLAALGIEKIILRSKKAVRAE